MFLSVYSVIYLISISMTIMATFTTNNWLMCWILMEINLMMFIPLITEKEYLMECPQSIKYFLVQVLGSMSLVLFLCLENSYFSMSMILSPNNLLMAALAIKSGIPPFHFWFPQILEFCNMLQCFLLLSVQKIIPLVLIQFCYSPMLVVLMIISAVVGAYGGINQNSLKKILAYSSMAHSSWMMLALNSSIVSFLMYLLVYTFISSCLTFMMYKMSLFKISEFITSDSNKMGMACFSLNMMSLGGLPPLLGFISKAVVLMEASSVMTALLFILILSSLVSLTYYTRVIWFAMSNSFYSKKEKLTIKESKESPFYSMNILMNIMLTSIAFSYL